MLLYAVHKKINKGFTLVEMITAVIIVGVIAASAAPNLLGMLNRTRVKEGLGQVEGAIREAQRLAVRKGKTCKIRFTPTGTGSDRKAVAQVRPDETVSGNTVSYSECLLSTREFDSEISLDFEVEDTSGNKTKTVIYDPDSSVSTTAKDLVFSSKGNTESSSIGTIIVSRTGTDTQKCLQIEGILGNIITGDYVDTNNDNVADDCDAK